MVVQAGTVERCWCFGAPSRGASFRASFTSLERIHRSGASESLGVAVEITQLAL